MNLRASVVICVHAGLNAVKMPRRIDSSQRVVLDMASTEIPVYGEQEHSASNGHFESTCYHLLLLFNGEGDCLAGKLRPGNVHGAADWDEVLLSEIRRTPRLKVCIDADDDSPRRALSPPRLLWCPCAGLEKTFNLQYSSRPFVYS